jgi:hypothetical protein
MFLAACQFQRRFWEPGAFYRNLGSGAFDLIQIVRRQFDFYCPDIFLQAMELCGARNGDNPRLWASNQAMAIGAGVARVPQQPG